MKLRGSSNQGDVTCIPAFAGLLVETETRLADGTVWRDASPGERIYSEGDAATSVFLLLEGDVRIFHASGDGSELLVSLLRGPCIFGLADALVGGTRREHAQASTAALIGELSADVINDVMGRDATAARNLARELAARLGQCTVSHKALAFDPIPKRAATYLLECAALNNPPEVLEPVIAVTQDVIASSVCATRRSIASAMSMWQAEGILARRGNGYVIRDVDALKRVAH